jgi:hypothetical protein
MLIENTGQHMLDSGGHYGRHWQRNRVVNFKDLPEFEYTVEESNGEVGLYGSIPLFHFLNAYCEITESSKKLQKMFMEHSHLPEVEDESWLSCIYSFIEKYNIKHEYGGNNSYNLETVLSQGIQFQGIEINHYDNPQFAKLGIVEGEYILLQIHGGCDIRGGYTKPKVFACEYEDLLCSLSSIDIWCRECNTGFYSDDSGYHWYCDEYYPTESLTQLFFRRIATWFGVRWKNTKSFFKSPKRFFDGHRWSYYKPMRKTTQYQLKHKCYVKDEKLYCKSCNEELVVRGRT